MEGLTLVVSCSSAQPWELPAPLENRGETKTRRAKATCPRSRKDVSGRSRSGVQMSLHPILVLVLFVAFPKISPDTETEAAGLFVGSLWGGGLPRNLTHMCSHPGSHMCLT